MLNSKDFLSKINEHRYKIGEEKANYTEGAMYGYSIALKQLKEKDNEISRLRKKLAKNYHIDCGCSYCQMPKGK